MLDACTYKRDSHPAENMWEMFVWAAHTSHASRIATASDGLFSRMLMRPG